MEDNIATVSVIGLGKLGAPMVACFAARGLQVIGVDVDTARVAALADGHAPVCEPGLQEMLDASRERITAMADCEAAVKASEATFLIEFVTESNRHSLTPAGKY